ncbi:MAG: glycosyltransferase [Roseibacillus sp.]|nr:glycosyltransferase [Roseibacillus sp.]
MSVALIHYHLRPGGVTRVIQRQSEALTQLGVSHVVLAGTPPEEPSRIPVAVVPSLDYQGNGEPEGARLTRKLLEIATRALGEEPACWHLHNPILGKNVHFPGIVAELAERRVPLVLHLHDFAEDGRPENYEMLPAHEQLYPLAPQIRYATINSRDHSLLLAAGIPEGQTSLLPNAVTPPVPRNEGTLHPHAPLILYPVRGIRRKNLGEFCLLSALAPPGSSFALALAPDNLRWGPAYGRWQRQVEQDKLPVKMGVVGQSTPPGGTNSSYASWLAHSTHLITTSIAEGFGLTFLEPIALGKPLLGRDLPEITSDFVSQGAGLGCLYQRLLVPRAWINESRFLALLDDSLCRLYRSYGEPLPPRIFEETHAVLTHGEYLDFGNLPEELQLEIFPRARIAPGEVLVHSSQSSVPVTEWLTSALQNRGPSADSGSLEPWALSRYAEAHQDLYRQLTTVTPAKPSWLNRRILLRQFLRPERFHFLRS